MADRQTDKLNTEIDGQTEIWMNIRWTNWRKKDSQTDRLMNTQTDRQTYTHNTKNVKTYYIHSSLMGRYIMIIKVFTTLLIFDGL